ncbi:MAG: hypothetical protein ACM3SS_05355 [Rhodospirillaceae bacterium]
MTVTTSPTGATQSRQNWASQLVPYRDLQGNSGVVAYYAGDAYIIVEFQDGAVYLYNATAPGQLHVEEMIRRARQGSGLATYIKQEVREHYALKLRD